MFHSGSMVSKGASKSKGKWAVGGIWMFFVKTVMGQIGQMKSMVLNKTYIQVTPYDVDLQVPNNNTIYPHSKIGRVS